MTCLRFSSLLEMSLSEAETTDGVGQSESIHLACWMQIITDYY